MGESRKMLADAGAVNEQLPDWFERAFVLELLRRAYSEADQLSRVMPDRLHPGWADWFARFEATQDRIRLLERDAQCRIPASHYGADSAGKRPELASTSLH